MPFKVFVIPLFFFLLFTGCKKPEEYPIIPEISFKNISVQLQSNGKISLAAITISFTDGDGDLGYKQAGLNDPIFDDTASTYYYNFIIRMEELINGVWVNNNANLSGRMPYLTPEGKNKNLKGDITMNVISFPPSVVNKTIRYRIFIYDRALHQSNTVYTDAIIINT
ncbi:MAG: hypothetical protein RIQ89_661 [Bacteroidota bacterium]|jgi:hypothetical protein